MVVGFFFPEENNICVMIKYYYTHEIIYIINDKNK